jgi:hypothetical protein
MTLSRPSVHGLQPWLDSQAPGETGDQGRETASLPNHIGRIARLLRLYAGVFRLAIESALADALGDLAAGAFRVAREARQT